MSGWVSEKTDGFLATGGYQKPDHHPGALKLDSNENYAIPKQFQADIISSAKRSSDVREYPLGGAGRLTESLARFLGVPPSTVGVGNGSDQILDVILANYASKRTRVLTSDPTFGFFEERCKLYGIPVTAVPFSDGMRLDIDSFAKKAKGADILYLDSPNNPTGFQFPRGRIRELVRSFEGLVIIDEAYGPFGDYTLSGMAKSQENLVVVQTLSKSFGLAGLRLGYFVASKRFTEAFMQVLQSPYPLGTITIEAGIAALERADVVRDAIGAIKSERKRIIETLREYDAFEVFDSKANFVLFDARSSHRRVYSALLEQGISIRKLGKVGRHEGCLRVTVGTREMNSKFLLAVRDLLG